MSGGHSKPTVIVYRDRLLPRSETFVLSQGEALRRYTALYVGSRHVGGLALPHERTLTVNSGGLPGFAAEIVYKMCVGVTSLDARLREAAPVLLHAHFAPDASVALPLARRLGLPLVTTVHGYDATVTDGTAEGLGVTWRLFRWRKAQLQQNGTIFIAISNFIARKLIEQGYPSDRVVQHYVGVDLSVFTPDATVVREPVVLFVGRLVEQKGCQHLIRAMVGIQEQLPEVELVILGDGPFRGVLESLAARSLRRYRFLGFQDPVSVRSWMNRSRVFCAPSITGRDGWQEGFGLVFAEAQATGLPVVSFATGGIPEAVAHGETGLLAPEGDWEQLGRNILTLLLDPRLMDRFGRAGRQRVATRFDLEAQTRALEVMYDGVVEHQPRGVAA